MVYFTGHYKDFGFSSNSSGDPLAELEPRSKFILFMFLKQTFRFCQDGVAQFIPGLPYFNETSRNYTIIKHRKTEMWKEDGQPRYLRT